MGAVTMTAAVDWAEFAARAFEPQPENQWASPGALARYIDPQTVQTAALDLLDDNLVDVAAGRCQRLIWSMPPQEGKSERTSRRFPLWLLVRNPELRIAIVSYELGVARRWGRAIRNDIAEHPELGLTVRQDTSAAHEWQLEGHRGGVYSVGIGGALTGRPVDLLLVDDPLKGRKEADSPTYRNACKDFYTDTARTRLAPGAPVVIIQCMTGDTPVLMDDGTEKSLRDVRPGDAVATYENGTVTTATVCNWANQGPDAIYSIKMKSGTVVRANARHPFLTIQNGVETWQRTDTLKKGSLIQRVTGVSGEASPAPSMAATSPQSARGCATRTTTSSVGQTECAPRQSMRKRAGLPTFATATASMLPTMTGCSQSRADSALFVSSRRPRKTPVLTGTGSSASITVTTPAECADCSVTTATSSSATAGQRQTCGPQPPTYAIEPDEVVEVVLCGLEDVYDLQIDRTENFIANGLVSHNTRWHEDDLSGWLLSGPSGSEWRYINVPAQAEDASDPLGRQPGEYLTSARGRTPEDWEATRRDVGARTWAALYQGRPAPAEGGLFKRSHWRWYSASKAIRREDGSMWAHGADEIIQSWDMAFKDTKASDFVVGQVWARFGADVFLLDQVRDRLDFPASCRAVQTMSAKWPQANAKYVEDKANGPAIIAQLRASVPGLIPITPKDSKYARAAAVSPFVESGNVHLPDPALAPWIDEYVVEHGAFPNSPHDDQVDATTQALHRMLGGGGSMEQAMDWLRGFRGTDGPPQP